MNVQPYLFFDGRCAEALDFYREAIGAEIEMMMRYKDSPEKDAQCGDGSGETPPPDAVMHATFHIGSATLMASDGYAKGAPKFEGISLSLTVPNKDAAERTFAALGAGGQVQQPLIQTFFSPAFGMVADKFGVSWMVYVAP